jgi:hypothetical protein
MMRVALNVLLILALAGGAYFAIRPAVMADAGTPRVELNAENLGPRSIEDLTEKSIKRDYGLAWQTMAAALRENQIDLLDGYFTGIAKATLAEQIADQKRSGVRLHYTDQGHKLEAVFYSPAGDAMQLRDRAQVEVEIIDGDKVVHRENVTLNYLVLMTPGADRWLVRDLQTSAAEVRP